MISFYEYLAKQKAVGLPDSATMLAKLGITPDVPHEIDVMRMVKQMKRQPAPNAMGDLLRHASTKARQVCSALRPANPTSQDGRTMPPERTTVG